MGGSEPARVPEGRAASLLGRDIMDFSVRAVWPHREASCVALDWAEQAASLRERTSSPALPAPIPMLGLGAADNLTKTAAGMAFAQELRTKVLKGSQPLNVRVRFKSQRLDRLHQPGQHLQRIKLRGRRDENASSPLL